MNQSSWESPTDCPETKAFAGLLPACIRETVLSARRSVTTNRAIDEIVMLGHCPDAAI